MAGGFRQRGFTLIEVLIVVVIVSVLAAVIIPQFTDCSNDAKSSTLKHNLYTMRAQIEMYKCSHGGTVPTLQNSTLAQLISATDATGAGHAGANVSVRPVYRRWEISDQSVRPEEHRYCHGGLSTHGQHT